MKVLLFLFICIIYPTQAFGSSSSTPFSGNSYHCFDKSTYPLVSMTAKNDNNNNKREDILSKLLTPQSIKYAATFLGGAIIAAAIFASSPPTLKSTDDIPQHYFNEKRILEGDIVKVIDGDTYKFYNINGWQKFFGGSPKSPSDALTIRIAAVDTPETPKFGQLGQKFGIEAKEYATKKLLGKRVKVKLLKKDQYNRVLGVVRYRDGFHTNLDISEELLKEGLATVYRQGGAQYDDRLKTYTYLENQAIQARKGMWKNGKDKADLPSEYKKKLKAKASVSP